MELKDFIEAVENQIDNFIESESFLLENEINERTITHKLAEYIQALFQDCNVDCEYNKMQKNEGIEEFITKILNLQIDYTRANDENGTTVFPDIIVHTRGTNEKNLLIIEVKKKKYAEAKKTSDETYRDFDKRKIRAYMTQLLYKHGLYIEFDGKEYTLEWF